jgi:hypothetical protein
VGNFLRVNAILIGWCVACAIIGYALWVPFWAISHFLGRPWLMLIPMCIIYKIGADAGKHADWLSPFFIACVITFFSLAMGAYWSIFDGGDGLGYHFTYNRISAAIAFLAVFMIGRWKTLRAKSQPHP